SLDQTFHVPHSSREIRFRNDPPASKAAQPIRFRQTTRANEMRSMADRRRPLAIHTFQINFIHQYARAATTRNFSETFQIRFEESRAGRIMQIGYDNQTCTVGYKIFETTLTWKSLYLGAEILCGGQQWLISGILDEHLVARLDEDGHGDEVCHRCTRRRDDAFRRHTAVCSDGLLQRLESI